MYKDTVTLFNRSGDTWRAAVLPRVDLNADRAALIAKYGADSKDKASLHVRYWPTSIGLSVLDDTEDVCLFKEPKEYAGADHTLTFRPASTGEILDFFMDGAWDGERVIRDADYDTGFFDHMSATRDGVYTITSVARYSVISHFEILGR